MTFRCGDSPEPVAEDLLSRFAHVEVATLGHITDFGFPRGLQWVTEARRFVGPALTVRIPHLDSTAVHYAIDLIRAGDVIVIDHSGDTTRSSFGGGLAKAAQLQGAVGAVSTGSTNDITELDDLGFPVYSCGRTPHTTRVLGIEGAVNVPVSVGGVVVRPGDIVIADPDGVAVVEPEIAQETIERLEAIEARLAARDVEAYLASGRRFASIAGADRLFEEQRVSA